MTYSCIFIFVLVGIAFSGAYRIASPFISTVSRARRHQPLPLIELRCAVQEDAKARTAEEIEAEAEQKLIERINAEVLAESGVELDQLINPSKVVNLERDLIRLADELQSASNNADRQGIESQIAKKQKVLFVEKRSVMRGWLKNLFVGQSILAVAISFAMVQNALPNTDLPLSVQVLGFWMWWLFIIPSLRYDIAIPLLSPLYSHEAPVETNSMSVLL